MSEREQILLIVGATACGWLILAIVAMWLIERADRARARRNAITNPFGRRA